MKLNTKDRKKFRIRNRLIKNNPNNRMRLTVSRSSKNISAQIIDDKTHKTLISATSNIKNLKDLKKKKSELSEIVATKLAEQANPLESLSNKIQQYLALETQIESKLTKLKKQLKFYEDNDFCDTCGQEIEDEFRQKQIHSSNTSISETTSGLEQLEQEITKSSERVSSLRELKEQSDELARDASNKGSTAAAIEQIIESLQTELEEVQVQLLQLLIMFLY